MSTGIRSEEKTTGTQYSGCLDVSPSLSGSVAMAGACPPAAGGKVPPGRPRQADVTMVPGIWQELSASSGYGWSWTEHQLQHQSKQAAQCHNTRGEWGLEPPLSPPLRLRLLGTLDWCDRASSWPTALAVTNHHCPTGRTGSAQLWRKDNRKRGQ